MLQSGIVYRLLFPSFLRAIVCTQLGRNFTRAFKFTSDISLMYKYKPITRILIFLIKILDGPNLKSNRANACKEWAALAYDHLCESKGDYFRT